MGSRVLRRSWIAVGVLAIAAATLASCSSTDHAGPSSTTTTAARVTETLPPTRELRVATPPDMLAAIATDIIIGALQAQGAIVTRVPMTLAGNATAALQGGKVDLAVLVAADDAVIQAEGAANGWIVLEPFAGDAGGGSAYPVITSDASEELGDLLEATISQATSSTDADTLAVLAREVVEGGRPTAEVIEEHLVGVGLIPEGG